MAPNYFGSKIKAQKARQKAYNQRPEVKAYLKAYRQRPENKARAKARSQQSKFIEQQRAYNARLEIKERKRIRSKAYLLHKKYGLTVEAFDSMLLGQGGVCAICGSDKWGHKGPCIDHDHSSGAVRGILCLKCNIAIGILGDSWETVRTAADYLEKNK